MNITRKIITAISFVTLAILSTAAMANTTGQQGPTMPFRLTGTYQSNAAHYTLNTIPGIYANFQHGVFTANYSYFNNSGAMTLPIFLFKDNSPSSAYVHACDILITTTEPSFNTFKTTLTVKPFKGSCKVSPAEGSGPDFSPHITANITHSAPLN